MEVLYEALKMGVTPGIIFAIYLVIVKYIEYNKEKNTTNVSYKIIETLDNINNYIIKVNNNIVVLDRTKCDIAISDCFKRAAYNIVDFAVRIVINNNIEINRDNVVSNLTNVINSEYYTICRTLKLYTIDDVNAGNVPKEVWKDEMLKVVIDIIYNKQLDKNNKILNISTRIDSLFSTYVTYIKNKILK